MDQNLPDILQQAKAYLKAGRPQAALPLLLRFVRLNPNSEQGWILLGSTVSDPQQQADCFIRALQINPGNKQAQEALNRLVAPGLPSAPPTPPTPPPSSPSSPASPALPPIKTSVFTSEINPVTQEPSLPFPPLGQVSTIAEGATKDLTPSVIQPVPTRSVKKTPPARRKKKKKRTPLVVLVVILTMLALLVCIGAGFLGTQYLGITVDEILVRVQNTAVALMVPPLAPAAASVDYSGPVPTPSLFILPPTWTSTSSPTPTPILSSTPTPTATPMATLPPPAPTTLAQMERISKEVSDLRGLPILSSVPSYLITRAQAKNILSSILLTDEMKQELHDEVIVLSSLGLIKPTYDLENYALNGLVDGIGGLYIPWEKEIYILGIGFRGMEHFIYSHEFDHALTDQHFKFSDSGVYPVCESNEQRCSAIRALVEGDATLLMYLWAEQYATRQDYKDILLYQPPIQALPEQDPPPYVLEDLNFPYKYGVLFVKFLYDRGNWGEVNKAYQRLPESSEQILHPQKYLDSEPPLTVQDPELESYLGQGYRLLKDEVLGEWMTYLLLAYGADISSQIKTADAQEASQGWGGDHYLVYHSEETGQTILAAHWLWDSQGDADEFHTAMVTYLENRFRGAKLDRSDGACWEINQQSTCLFQKDNRVLWLLTPNQSILDILYSQYTVFH
jgi:hypothetical protein